MVLWAENYDWQTFYCKKKKKKKIVIAITFSKSMDHSAPLMKSCNMLNILDINKSLISTFVYKCVEGRISVCENCYNGVPMKIKSLNNPESFKYNLNFLLQQCV